MNPTRLLFSTLLLAVAPAALAAQGPARPPAPVAASRDTETVSDTAHDATDDEGVPLGLQFGVASGALHYAEGRNEQSLAGMLRWAPVRWFSLSTTPTAVHASSPPIAPSNQSATKSGLVDLPVEAILSHVFHARYAPTISGGLGVTLPVGDTLGGFGTGKVGYTTTAALGFAPTEQVWVHLGVGHSLSGLSAQSAFTGANGWGDVSAGYSLTDRLGVSGGYSTDVGAVDPTIGRSASINGGLALSLRGPLTLNLTTSHGLSGAAPSWSVAMGVGTAFPYLGHLDSGSLTDLLRHAFGGGTHGLSTGSAGGSGRGRHP